MSTVDSIIQCVPTWPTVVDTLQSTCRKDSCKHSAYRASELIGPLQCATAHDMGCVLAVTATPGMSVLLLQCTGCCWKCLGLNTSACTAKVINQPYQNAVQGCAPPACCQPMRLPMRLLANLHMPQPKFSVVYARSPQALQAHHQLPSESVHCLPGIDGIHE